MKKLSLLVAVCMLVSIFAGTSLFASAAEGVTVNIVSFTRGAQEDLRSSELLEAEVLGYDGNPHDLTYKWTNALGTYLYVYNSHNMYGINNTDGEIEIYNNNISASTNMSGRSYKDSFTGVGYGWAAVYGASVSSSDLVGKVTVEVYDANGNLLATDTHEGKRVQTGTIWGFIPVYENTGFIESSLEEDLSNIAFGMFEGDVKHINDLLGETGMVHVTCAECSVPSAKVTSGDEYIEVVSDSGSYSIHGIKKGVATVEIQVEKSNCKFHQETSVKTDVKVYTYRKPTTTSTATKIELRNLDPDCEYRINHVKGQRVTVDGEEIVLFEGLTPNTEYQIGVIGHPEGIDHAPVYAFVYETTKPAHTGTVEVVLNGTYDITTGTATGTRVDISKVEENVSELYLRYEDSELYFPLTKQAEGVYNAILSDGNYTVYTAENASSKLSDQVLTIAGASRTRYLFYNSVTYNLNGGTGGPAKLTEYYMSESAVNVCAEAPSKSGYIFTHWTDQNGNIYKPGDVLTNTISTAYTLTANYVKGKDVYVNIQINHVSGNEHNNDNGRHGITFTVDSRNVGEADYTEIISKSLDWNGTDALVDDYGVQFISQNDNEYTLYTATKPILVNVPAEKEYTFTAAKHGYEVSKITQTTDENGDLRIDAELIFNPNTFDMTYTVELDEAAKKVADKFKPAAVNVKILQWHDTPYDESEAVGWYTITQQKETYERIALNADGTGVGTFPVWMETTDKHSPYYYRIEVVSYELKDGTIISASDKDGNKTTYVTPEERYWANINVTDGKAPSGSTLDGVYYTNSAQQGAVKAVISIEVFDIILDGAGGTVDGTNAKIKFEDQIEVPDIDSYTPVRDGGYIFNGWYYADANGNATEKPARTGDVIQEDSTIVATWKEPLTVKGTVTVSGFYEMDETARATKFIPDQDRGKNATVILQRIDMNGYPETVATLNVPLTYDQYYGKGTYEFAGLPDVGEDYRIKILATNYNTTYQNEPESKTAATSYELYDTEQYVAKTDGDKEAVVNAYLQFSPRNFALHYDINATAIGEGFRPDSVETLILCDDGTKGSNPQDWTVISQLTDGAIYKGQKTDIQNGKGSNYYDVWTVKPDGITPYDYAIKVQAYTKGTETKTYVEANEPFRITYNGHARFSDLNGQSQTLTAMLVPRMYSIHFDLGLQEGDTVKNMEKYLVSDGTFADTYYWSHGKAVTAEPVRGGYEFLGWKDAQGNTVAEIPASSYGNVTLYAQWEKVNVSFEILVDTGYYAAKAASAAKVGVISFNARVTNFEEVKEDITSYSFYLHDVKGKETKVEITDIETIKESNGEFHTIISNIALNSFEKMVHAIPYIVAHEAEYIGQEMTACVNTIKKWLGPNNPYAE